MNSWFKLRYRRLTLYLIEVIILDLQSNEEKEINEDKVTLK